jgi:indolepyruvate ferredoxin oxidoreductase beta subunit
MKKKLDLVIAGVGGQGNILLSRIVGQTAARAGIEVQISEAFGSAQRGGAVFSNVRLGKSYSPVIPLGKADALLALEPGEALRQSRFLARNGLALVNTTPLMPVEVLAGKATYPPIETIRDLMRELTSNLYMIDAAALAEQAGDARTANTVMLGALDGCDFLPFQSGFLRESMIGSVPSKMVEANLKAFDLGRASVLAQNVT